MDRMTQKRLIQLGAKSELAELRARTAVLEKLLEKGPPARVGKPRRTWSAAQRKAAAERMRKVWATKRKEK
jgi:hypothetical protein